MWRFWLTEAKKALHWVCYLSKVRKVNRLLPNGLAVWPHRLVA